MSGRPTPLVIPSAVLEQVFEHAREAFPAECCGWLAGAPGGAEVATVRRCQNAQSDGDHPTQAARGEETAYVIAGSDLLALNKSFDGEQPARVIYHSHPNGRAYFSATDREVASSPWGDGPTYPVQQLVVGIEDRKVTEAALFAWSEDRGDFVEIARWGPAGEAVS